MTNIVWQHPDGGILITHMTPEASAHLDNAKAADAPEAYKQWVKNNIGETLEEHAAILKARGDIHPEYTLAAVSAQIPQDRSFRDAWHHDGEGVAVHMGQARDIHKNRLREKRKAVFAILDAEYMKADETGDAAKKQAVAVKKQALRDITQHPEITAAATPEALKTAALSAFGTDGA
jgi:hypothetical protein